MMTDIARHTIGAATTALNDVTHLRMTRIGASAAGGMTMQTAAGRSSGMARTDIALTSGAASQRSRPGVTAAAVVAAKQRPENPVPGAVLIASATSIGENMNEVGIMISLGKQPPGQPLVARAVAAQQ